MPGRVSGEPPKYCRNLDIITVTSTKIVDIAIRNAGIDQRIFDGRTAFLAFYHHEERTSGIAEISPQ